MHRQAEMAVGVGILFFEGGADRVCIGIGLVNRHSRFEAADYAQKMRAALRRHRWIGAVADHFHANRSPELRWLRGEQKLKARGHDSDNGVRLRVKNDRTTNDVGAGAEMRSPQVMAQNRDARAGLILRRDECAAEQWLGTEDIEDIRADDALVDMQGLAGTCERRCASVIDADGFERAILRAK